MSEFVGGPIDERVIKQIKIREDILGRKTTEDAEKYVQFKVGNNAWIRVI